MSKLRPSFLSDEKLWEQFCQGNKSAFSKIYQRYAEDLFAYGLKITTEQELVKDTIQDLFVELWKKRNQLEHVEQIKFYLLKSLRYKLLRALKNKQRYSENYSFLNAIQASPETIIITEELSQEKLNRLHTYLSKLPDRQKEVLHLRFFQNLKNEEIAELLNINYQSVANLIYKAIKNLKRQFSKP